MTARCLLLATTVLALAGCPSEAPEPGTPPEPTPAPPLNPLDETGPFGVDVWSTAEPFRVETTEGRWYFADSWDGDHSYVFVQASGSGYTRQIWDTSVADLVNLLRESGKAHYFFVWRTGGWEAEVDALKARFDAALDELDEEDAEVWRTRLHYVAGELSDVGGWPEEVLSSWPNRYAGTSSAGFAIDRFQRLRELGLLGFPGTGNLIGNMRFLANETRHYDHEFERESGRAARGTSVVEVPIWTAVEEKWATITLPDAATMEGFDTLDVDLTMGCPEGTDARCYEWDYKAAMYACEAIDAPPPADACQWEVRDGDGNVTTPADTQACGCTSPWGGAVERTRSCQLRTDKAGQEYGAFGECPCECNHELARWITAYSRHGQWLTDITPSLAVLRGGGPVRIQLDTPYTYVLSGAFRLSNQGRDDKPFAQEALWGGGDFGNPDVYNEQHGPRTFTPPAGTRRVELVVWATGHGFGQNTDNCAEFCNHTHHFAVNGGAEHVREHPEADEQLGCMEQVPIGVVPNQFGTWPYGRGGWCPGQDVPPWRADVTADVDLAGENTITYWAGLRGQEWSPTPANNGGFGPSIWLTSRLVYYR